MRSLSSDNSLASSELACDAIKSSKIGESGELESFALISIGIFRSLR